MSSPQSFAKTHPQSLKGPRILVVSNGHGEDLMACSILDRFYKLCPNCCVTAWPMVGSGSQYALRGIETIGPSSRLPSQGFGTLDARLFARDIAAGWIGLHIAQAQAARGLAGRYDVALAVGDVEVMAACVLARLPFFFVGCAKSVYYRRGYTALEKYLLKKYALLSFARDEPTAIWMKKQGMACRFEGTPCMDNLEPTGRFPHIRKGSPVLALLPGSRKGLAANTRTLFEVLSLAQELGGFDPPLTGLLAAVQEWDLERFLSGGLPQGWQELEAQQEKGLCKAFVHKNRARILVYKDRFADILNACQMAVGLAGTANEQAVGLGKPLVTFPAKGPMGKNYVKMKMELFGQSAVATKACPKAAAMAVVDILKNPQKQAAMGMEGKTRMGGPGASAAIAKTLAGFVENNCGH
ncbi:MAG: lipid-A-disaccharide synthase-related protein [Desulfatibacillaceae bacterium]|nr:lipid-A-disaccharide synthase-related protein [Desulfatibacillaceae bacterium]